MKATRDLRTNATSDQLENAANLAVIEFADHFIAVHSSAVRDEGELILLTMERHILSVHCTGKYPAKLVQMPWENDRVA
jgi:hypothetical protein